MIRKPSQFTKTLNVKINCFILSIVHILFLNELNRVATFIGETKKLCSVVLLADCDIDFILSQSGTRSLHNKSVSGKCEPIVVYGGRALCLHNVFMVSTLSHCVSHRQARGAARIEIVGRMSKEVRCIAFLLF